jgi:DNA-binding FrmR family transcriptional regulator
MNEQLEKAVFSLKTARGQIDSIINMIDEGRYCVDISNQIMAVISLLKKSNLLVLEQHLNHCVREAFNKGSSEEKTKEIINILARIQGK